MQKRSLKTSSILFLTAIIIQISCAGGNFYFQQKLNASRQILDQLQEIEREYFRLVSKEDMSVFSQKTGKRLDITGYDFIIHKSIHSRSDIAELIRQRQQLLEDVQSLVTEKKQMHETIRGLLPSLSGSIQYIHDHHIAHLENLINSEHGTPEYGRALRDVQRMDHGVPETDLIKAAINIQSSVLTIFETFSKLQFGISPKVIRTEFNRVVHEFYETINRFEDYSLDAQDGILVEELILNGQTFESSFKRFLEIETGILIISKKLNGNNNSLVRRLAEEKAQLNRSHLDLEQKITSLQYLLLTAFIVMFVFLTGYGFSLVRGFRQMVDETRSIQNDIKYRIPIRKRGFREFAIVFEALNTMAGTIQKQLQDLKGAKDKLERRVTERTKQISLVNEKLKIEMEDRIEGEKQRRELEKRLFQASKMEAIGTLSGGIAHDFNNILSGILGYSQLAQNNISSPDKLEKYFFQIIKGTRRAAELIQQILTFSRQTEIQKKPLQIAIVVEEAIKLLRSSIPSSIEVQQNIASNALVLADPTQIHQVVMNLGTNGYQAMQDTGGALTIELTDEEVFSSRQITDIEIPVGSYIKLVITDTGIGMAPDTLQKIFDPYFTTKKVGEGSGLGLAVVYAIVDEHGGYIKAESKHGKGACFQVFFPAIHEPGADSESSDTIDPVLGQGEHIMVIDDEISILDSTREYLTEFGYEVNAFSDPESALVWFNRQPEKTDLVISDMTMPKMTGDRLAAHMLKIRKGLPIILCSGYQDRFSSIEEALPGVKTFLQKPVIGTDLLIRIRELL